jgi:hypothetical protein
LLGKLSAEAIVPFHDSVQRRPSAFYGADRKCEQTMCLLIDRHSKTPGNEVLTLPFACGVTLVRGQPESLHWIHEPIDAG